jgi:signal transduction histidine kinase
MNGRPLRFQITLLAVIVTGLGMTVFAAIMLYQLRTTKLLNIDDEHASQAAQFFEIVEQRTTPIDWTDDDSVRALFQKIQSFYTIEVEEPRGTIVYRSNSIGLRDLPRLPDGHPQSASAGDAPVRVYSISQGDIRFRIATGLGPTLATERNMLVQFAIAVPVMCGLIGLGALWLTRKALRPVEELTTRAETITASNLTERLPELGGKDEIANLSRTLNRMMDRLQSSFEQSRRFASDASHELKTPLTIIRGETDAAMRSGSLPPGAERSLVNIQEETGRLVHIVEGLLILSQADAGKFRLALQPHNLSEFISEMAEDVEILATPRDIDLKIDIEKGIIVDAEPHFLRQAALNLFDNAVKYNRDSGRIEASLGRNGREAVFRIANTTDHPVTEGDKVRVFDRFFRADKSRDRERGGQGLGLSICAEIIRAHHGQIMILDDPRPDWTAFEFRIPMVGSQS